MMVLKEEMRWVAIGFSVRFLLEVALGIPFTIINLVLIDMSLYPEDSEDVAPANVNGSWRSEEAVVVSFFWR